MKTNTVISLLIGLALLALVWWYLSRPETQQNLFNKTVAQTNDLFVGGVDLTQQALAGGGAAGAGQAAASAGDLYATVHSVQTLNGAAPTTWPAATIQEYAFLFQQGSPSRVAGAACLLPSGQWVSAGSQSGCT